MGKDTAEGDGGGERRGDETGIDPRLVVDPSDVSEHYFDFAEAMHRREARVTGDLPVEGPGAVRGSIARAAEELGSGERTLRSVVAINALHEEVEEGIPGDLVRAVAGLDATVNALDDIVDTQDLGQHEKVSYAINVVFSQTLLHDAVPSRHDADLVDLQYEYLTGLSQIPLIERRLLERFREATTTEKRVAVAARTYANVATVVDGFVRIPAAACDLPESTVDRIVSDVAACHARQLLFEELRQVERDLEQGDENPVLLRLREASDPGEVASFVRSVAAEFEYSDRGAETYGEVLRSLERRPDDLEVAVAKAMAAIGSGSDPAGRPASAPSPAVEGAQSPDAPQISEEYVQISSALASARGGRLCPSTFGVLAGAKHGCEFDALVEWGEERGVAGRGKLEEQVERLASAGLVQIDGDHLHLDIEDASYDQLASIAVSMLS